MTCSRNPSHRWNAFDRQCRDCSNERNRQRRANMPTKARSRKCNDPTHTWNVKQSRCDSCRRNDGQPREGDRGPVECTVDYDEWCKATGYDPATGTYSNTPQHIEPAWVQTADEGGFSYPEELTHA